MAFLDSVSNLAGAASNKIGQLSTIAKGVLCIPSLISGLKPSDLKKLGGQLLGSISGAIAESVGALTDLVLQGVQDQVNKISGAINGLVSTLTGLVATIAGVIELGKNFAQTIRDQVEGVKDFISNKENCQFAMSTLANCIISQTVNNVSNKVVKDIGNGFSSVNDAVSEITNKISEPTGAIGGFLSEASREVNKASSVIQATKLL